MKFCKRKFLKTVDMNKFCHVKFLHPGLDYGYSRLKLDAWKSRLKRRVGRVWPSVWTVTGATSNLICHHCKSHMKRRRYRYMYLYINIYTIYTYLPAHDISAIKSDFRLKCTDDSCCRLSPCLTVSNDICLDCADYASNLMPCNGNSE